MKKAKLIKKTNIPALPPKRPAKNAPQPNGPAVDPRVKFADLFGNKKQEGA